MVVQGHHNLPPVVAVDDADLVRRGQALLAGHAAAGIDQPGAAYRHLQCNARGDKGGASRFNGNGRFQTGGEVGARRLGGAIGREGCSRTKYFDTNGFHQIIPFLSPCQSSQRTISPASSDLGTSMSRWLADPRNRRLRSFFASMNGPSTSTSR